MVRALRAPGPLERVAAGLALRAALLALPPAWAPLDARFAAWAGCLVVAPLPRRAAW